ncbi:MAG: ATP-binding protein [Candidatus Methanoplasma sp.]|jgi:hypothetical protein|nr:ATP-binding protein [Candidatus Methanoplasma sp.]
MVTGSAENHLDHVMQFDGYGLLKANLIFGPNASGKTNLFKAILYSRDYILKHPAMWGSPGGEHLIGRNRFASPDAGATRFEYSMETCGEQYRYGFEVTEDPHAQDGEMGRNLITGEWLYQIYADIDDEPIFERRLEDGRILLKFGRGVQECEHGIPDSRETLVLTAVGESIKAGGAIAFGASRDPAETDAWSEDHRRFLDASEKVYRWFRDTLAVISPNEAPRHVPDYRREENAIALSEIMSKLDLGIREIDPKVGWARADGRETEGAVSGDDIACGSVRPVFKIYHHGIERPFDVSDESEGAKWLLDLAQILIYDESDRTYVVDEIDRCLHPLMTYDIVEYFISKSFEKNKQLVATAHQAMLIDPKLLRRDEIVFVEKDMDGITSMFSLDDYRERPGENVMGYYLDGRYGAVPRISLHY